MTRETKIGLLVGLAFIIVIGILLSDHMATTTEPTQAALNDAQANNRSAIVVPNEGVRGASLPQNITPREITPSNTILTRNETVRGPVVGDISISGPGSTNTNNTPRGNGNTGNTTVSGPGDAVATNDPGPTQPENHTSTTPGNTTGIDPNLQALAERHGAELEVPGGRTQGNTREPQPRENTQAQRPTSTQKTYTVEAGDTLGRIASKAMGANSKANRDAIVKANPSLQANPDKVVLGAVYVIPTAAAPTNATANGNTRVLPLQPVTPPTGTNTREARETSRDNANTITYTVKANDTLIAIAREKLGSPQAVGTIKDLNKDVLKGGDALRIGMRLKLPAKPVASAN